MIRRKNQESRSAPQRVDPKLSIQAILEKKLNYTFRNPALLGEALSHSSYANEHRANHLNSNERLEFLGDSVLGFVTAEFLFAQHLQQNGRCLLVACVTCNIAHKNSPSSN